MDRYAVVWSRSGPEPVKMGDLVVTDLETRFSYAESFLDSGNPDGLSLIAPPALFGREPVVFRTRQGFPFHPRLLAFVPGHGRNNIQRRIYEKILAAQKNPPQPGLETDWEIILLAAQNGIGHIDVFRDDATAQKWYDTRRDKAITQADRRIFWHMIKEDIAQDMEVMDANLIAKVLGPTPSVGGMIPKLLVSIPDNGQVWDGTFSSAGTRSVNGTPYIDVLLKVEPREYEGIVALESLCLDLHKGLDFRVPRHWVNEVDGMRLLAVERFDRRADRSIPMESFMSIFAGGSSTFSGNEDTDWEEVSTRLEKLAELANLDVSAAQKELYRRIALAFCTGNGDMHLENVSLLGGSSGAILAPVYDPAPMRAWPQHDTRSAVPMPIEEGLGFFGSLAQMGTAFGYTKREAIRVLEEMLETTRDYTEQVKSLTAVPQDRRERLVKIVERERLGLGEALDGMKKRGKSASRER
jgi:serine/threonine-protein kinase HipA